MIQKMYQSFIFATGFVLGFLSFHFIKRHLVVKRLHSSKFKFVTVVRTDIGLRNAERIELCVQAAVECYKNAVTLTPEFVKLWKKNSQPKIAVRLDENYESEAQALKRKAAKLGLVAVGIIKTGRVCVMGIGPGPQELIDQVTGHLKLLG